jgi:hypothetical protein
MKKRIRGRDGAKQSHWEEVMRRWQQSGQSIRSFCRAEGLRESAFYFWRSELARRRHPVHAANGLPPQPRRATPVVPLRQRLGRRQGPAPAFLPMQVVAPAGRYSEDGTPGRPETTQGVEIILRQGRSVRVRAGFDRQTLADVLSVLEVQPC